MIIYEVNLSINNDIYNEYYEWLVTHINEILQYPGFKKAEISQVTHHSTENDEIHLVIHYFLENEHDLENYLKNHAPAMRNDGIKRFGSQFHANRRIFKPILICEL